MTPSLLSRSITGCCYSPPAGCCTGQHPHLSHAFNAHVFLGALRIWRPTLGSCACMHCAVGSQWDHASSEATKADGGSCLHRVLPASRERVCFTTWMSVMKSGSPPSSLSRLHQLSKAGGTSLRTVARLLRLMHPSATRLSNLKPGDI